MDTKLKNSPDWKWEGKKLVKKAGASRNFIYVAIAMLLLYAACNMVVSYPGYVNSIDREATKQQYQEGQLVDIVRTVMRGTMFLSAQVNERAENEMTYKTVMESYGEDDFFLLKKFLSYEITDEKGEVRLSTLGGDAQGELLAGADSYALYVRFAYDEYGELRSVDVTGGAVDKELQNGLEQTCYSYDTEISGLKTEIRMPENVVAVYAISQQSLEEYLELTREDEVYGYSTHAINDDETGNLIEFYLDGLSNRMYAWAIFIVLVALLIPFNKAWDISREGIFSVCLEAVLAVWFFISLFANAFTYSVLMPALQVQANYSGNGIVRLFRAGRLYDVFLNMFIWFLLFAAVYWSATCLRAVFTMRGDYFRQRVWCIRKFRSWRIQKAEHKRAVAEGRAQKQRFSLRRCLKSWMDGIQGCFLNVYDTLLHIDFQNRTNRTILTIVVINFFVLLAITWLWFYGVFALLVYSVLLFYFLRRYFDDIRMKYTLLLKSTNQLAAGNLDVEIEGDFGIYNPVKDELKKIQAGFQRAVQKEVKSERMKTELITNVSHDLKTPLTAIITYVDLLKGEPNERKREEYLAILDRKSQRLKVLIEDLFEISKAASGTVTLDLMNVDIVGLLKQVVFENEDKIKAADVKFRWRLPDEKVVMALDSQKTYRIFENLVVNITKYALPGTRAYIDMQASEREVSIIMKNVSAIEMDFNTDEITDRFVRGDASRNAEGSGLGLAIVKSFTELQKGTLKITTEADLFKICVTLPRQLVEPEQMMESVQETARKVDSEWREESAPVMDSGWKEETAPVMALDWKEGAVREKDPEWKEETVAETVREMRMEIAKEIGLDNVEGAS